MMGAKVCAQVDWHIKTHVYSEWAEVFSWLPRKTISNEWVWFKKVYVREVKNIIEGGSHNEYDTLLDILK